MIPVFRRTLLIAGAALALASCGGETDSAANTATAQTATPVETPVESPPASEAETAVAAPLVDKALGPEDAAVTITEYASTTCPHCAEFHATVVLPVLKPYAQAGKIRYVFRDFPTPPVNLAVAGAVIARCAPDEIYFDVLDDLFASQSAIFEAAQAGEARQALEALSGRHGLTPEEMDACLQNEALRDEIITIVEDGQARGVASTPTVFLNDRKLTVNESRTAEAMTNVIEAALAEAATSGAE